MNTIFGASLVIFTIVVSISGQEDELGTVIFSHILFRHGERMPLEFYPTDPYKDSSNWPFEAGQLTSEGIKQEYELGKWLRVRYSSLVSPEYHIDDIYVRSTDVDRTLMSAQACLAGFYHLAGVKDEGMSVPVHTVPEKDDNLLFATATCPCPAYQAELSAAKNLPEIKDLQRNFELVYEYVSSHAGLEVKDFTVAVSIYDTLTIEHHYNKSLPNWTNFIFPEHLKEVSLYSFVFPTWTTLLKRLKIGPLLKEMVEHFQAKRAGSLSPDRKLWFYSAHDQTVSALLNSLDAFDLQFPPYASCVMLELRLLNDKHFVTLVYRNSSTVEPQHLKILSCGKLCSLDKFISLVEHLLPTNWERECQIPTDKLYWVTVAAISVSIIILVLIALVVLIVLYCLGHFRSGNSNVLLMSTSGLSTEPKPVI